MPNVIYKSALSSSGEEINGRVQVKKNTYIKDWA